jgi:hypothetical protein
MATTRNRKESNYTKLLHEELARKTAAQAHARLKDCKTLLKQAKTLSNTFKTRPQILMSRAGIVELNEATEQARCLLSHCDICCTPTSAAHNSRKKDLPSETFSSSTQNIECDARTDGTRKQIPFHGCVSVLPMARSLAISGPAVNSAATSSKAHKANNFALLVDTTQKDKGPCSTCSRPSLDPTPDMAARVNNVIVTTTNILTNQNQCTTWRQSGRKE